MAVQALNPLCLLGALGLGVSLVQIHIYVDPLKKALQVCNMGWQLHPGAQGLLKDAAGRTTAVLAVAHRTTRS